MTPALAVVVPSVNGWEDLRGCLAALRADAQSQPLVPVEILVVDRVGPSVHQRVAETFPEVRLIEVPQDTSIPLMRARAFAAATAPLVAILEDHILVPPGWSRALTAAQAKHGGVVGGSLYNAATGTTVDCAAFFCEYSHAMTPTTAGPTEWLTGNNTVYPRQELLRHRAVVESGRWEDTLHRELRAAGVPLTACPEIAVAHKKHYSLREYLAQRYWYSRAYAGTRLAGRGWIMRLLYGGGALLLPPLVWVRTVGRVWRSAADRGRLVRSLPLISLFACAWGLGEAVGASFGPGDALSRVC